MQSEHRRLFFTHVVLVPLIDGADRWCRIGSVHRDIEHMPYIWARVITCSDVWQISDIKFTDSTYLATMSGAEVSSKVAHVGIRQCGAVMARRIHTATERIVESQVAFEDAITDLYCLFHSGSILVCNICDTAGRHTLGAQFGSAASEASLEAAGEWRRY